MRAFHQSGLLNYKVTFELQELESYLPFQSRDHDIGFFIIFLSRYIIEYLLSYLKASLSL